MYNVGLGDCIYLRVPDLDYEWHILIDCGNKFSSMDLLRDAIASLEAELPEHETFPGRKRLDLLVVTHPHEDHHKGFEARFFKNIKIDNLWLSPGFDRLTDEDTHITEKNGFQILQQKVGEAVKRIPTQALSDEFKEIFADLLRLSKDEAVEMLTDTKNPNALPAYNQISPLYVTAQTEPGKLLKFRDADIHLKILGPMKDIDHYYLGGSGSPMHLGLDDEAAYASLFPDPDHLPEIPPPVNVSAQDFNRLRSSIQANILAAADALGHATNNLSVILLLEWHRNRLLFPGDAEWSNKRATIKEPGSNGAWNVMWQKYRDELSKPLDFLKVGHHGSVNATPWTPAGAGKTIPLNDILNSLLPLPGKGQSPTARAVVSTERGNAFPTIPDPDVIIELGKRVRNTVKYTADEKIQGKPQPQRTDLEELPAQKPWIDLFFDPKG
jgi:beta-lactamase superfamily II metal-dependent hydrolase